MLDGFDRSTARCAALDGSPSRLTARRGALDGSTRDEARRLGGGRWRAAARRREGEGGDIKTNPHR